MSKKNQRLISIVIPVYNESTNLVWHHEIIHRFSKSRKEDYEIIYVNDGSSDESLSILKDLAKKHSNTRYISFSRNFGKEIATSAGLHHAKGDAVVIIDADGQHPITLVSEFIREWNNGNKVVIGIRATNTEEGWVKRYGSKVFNAIMARLSDDATPKNSTDFRLIDRQVVNEFKKLNEHNRITRGLIDWLGFQKAYVNFHAPERHDGKASYSVPKLIKLAIHALVSQTTKPLQFTGKLGGFVMTISALIGIFLLVEMFILRDPLSLNVTASGFLALFISFLIGVVLACQWLLALYIESIHRETQNRPLYIIEEQSKSSEQ